MPRVDFLGLPEGYQLWNSFRGNLWALMEVKTRPLLICEPFKFRPTLSRCLKEIETWEKRRARVRGEA